MSGLRAAIEAMLTIRPRPRARMAGTIDFARLKAAVRLVSIIPDQLSELSRSKARSTMLVPTEFTSTSMPASSTAASAAARAAGSAASATRIAGAAPAPLATAASVASRPGRVRPRSSVRAPAEAAATAVARPIPLPAPAIRTVMRASGSVMSSPPAAAVGGRVRSIRAR